MSQIELNQRRTGHFLGDLILSTDHNVYILGAGFSRDANMPLVSEFLTRMRDSLQWLIEQERNREAEAVRRVLEFRLKAASAAYWTQLDLENIEELFSLASAASDALNIDIQLAIAATIDYSRHVAPKVAPVKLRIRNPGWAQDYPAFKSVDAGPTVPGESHFEIDTYAFHCAKLLGVLQTGEIKGQNTFISFNYDTVLEDALSALGVKSSYGFERPTNPAAGSIPMVPPDKPSEIRVLKLHGSVNWAAQHHQEKHLRTFTEYADLVGEGLVPDLIPPTWKKTFQGTIGKVWQDAVQALRRATRLIVFGFSIPPTDFHFKYLLAAGLQENVSLRQFLFVDPHAELVKERAGSLLRKEYISSGLIAFQALPLSQFMATPDYLSLIGRPLSRDLYWK